MNQPTITSLLIFYGLFLMMCGVVSVIFIGSKAKTALISGGMSGLASLAIAFLNNKDIAAAPWAGLVLALLLLIVFSWRSAKTLFKIFQLIPSQSPDLNGKGVAFLIISLMAVVSIVVFIIQFINLI